MKAGLHGRRFQRRNGLDPRLSLAAGVVVCAWMLEGGTGRNGLIEPFRLDASFGVAGLVRPQELSFLAFALAPELPVIQWLAPHGSNTGHRYLPLGLPRVHQRSTW